MKKVLSLVLAIVMMASLLVVSTSAAAVPSTVIIGTSVEKLGNAYANATLPFVTDANAAGMDTLTFYSQELEKNFAVGTAGVPVSFYLYLGNNTTDALAAYGASRLFEGYNQTTDYTTVEVTKGYSLVSCTATLDTASVVYKVGEANVADKGLMLVTLAPVAGNITGGEVVIKFTHNAFQADTKTYNKTSKYLKFNYAVPGAASIKATTPVNNGKDGLLYTVGNGTLINDEMIKTVKGNSLMWTNAAADANTFVPGAYSVAVLFQKVTNLTPVTLSVTGVKFVTFWKRTATE